MTFTRWIATAGLIGATALPFWGCARQSDPNVLPGEVDATRLEVGEAFPDLVLPALDGSARAIREFRGEKLILHIFASW